MRCRRAGQEAWGEQAAFASGDIRRLEGDLHEDHSLVRFIYQGVSRGVKSIRDFTLAVEFKSSAQTLDWTITLANTSGEALEIGDLALPLPFNKEFIQDNLAN